MPFIIMVLYVLLLADCASRCYIADLGLESGVDQVRREPLIFPFNVRSEAHHWQILIDMIMSHGLV